MLSWSYLQVQDWLTSLGEGYKQYEGVFKEHGVDGPAIFELDEDILKDDFGITNKLHVKRILRAKDGKESLRNFTKARVAQDLKKITGVTIDLNGQAEVEEVSTVNCTSICRRATEALMQKGIEIDTAEPIAQVFRVVDEVLTHVIQQRIPLDTAECVTNLVINSTAEGSGATIMKVAKDEHAEIQKAQVATRNACIEVRTSVQKLCMHVQAFSDAVTAPEGAVSEDELQGRKGEISTALKTFVDKMQEISDGVKQGGEKMLERSHTQLQALTAGNQVVLDTISDLKKHTEAREKAAREHRALRNEKRPDLEMAFEARAGTLKKRRDNILSEIEDLNTEKARMEKLTQDQDTIVAQHEKFVHDANCKDQELRDWHIRFSWADKWGPEMDRYRQQADRAIASHKDERDGAVALKAHYQARIESVEQIIKKMNDVVQEMNTMMAEHGGEGKEGWRNTLESHDVFVLEKRMSDAKENVEACEKTLHNAMRTTGNRNPEAAANAMLMHHQSLLLIADSAKKGQQLAQFIKSLNELMTTYVSANLNKNFAGLTGFACRLRILPKGLGAIEEFHMGQQKRLDMPGERAQIIKGYVARTQRELDPKEVMQALLD